MPLSTRVHFPVLGDSRYVHWFVHKLAKRNILVKFITKCDGCSYKVRQRFLWQSVTAYYYKVRQVLQSVTIITKCDRTYIGWDLNAKSEKKR